MAQMRIPLDAQRFATGLTWKDYLAQMGDTRARTEDNYQKAALTEEERQFFSGLAQVRYALMLAENWCGDVHRNSPVLARIAEAMPNCELRVFFRDQNLDLADCFLNNGYRSIPIMVFFDKDWNEIGRWIERAHAATAEVIGIRARTLEAAAPGKQDAAMAEYRRQVQAEYDAPGGPLWRAAVQEVRLLLEQRLGLAGKKQGGEGPFRRNRRIERSTLAWSAMPCESEPMKSVMPRASWCARTLFATSSGSSTIAAWSSGCSSVNVRRFYRTRW